MEDAFEEWCTVHQELTAAELRVVAWELRHSGDVPVNLRAEVAQKRAQAESLFLHACACAEHLGVGGWAVSNPIAPVPDSDIAVAIADDHLMVRDALSAYLAGVPGLQVVGQAANGQEALQLLATRKVDVLLLDLAMPVLDGLDALRLMRGVSPGTKVLVLTAHPSERYEERARDAGASAYLVKDACVDALVPTIRALAGPAAANDSLI